ncbi:MULTISPECIES: hypothetical protein [Vibrio]|uniref:hypothetical protein n=1 Tax=Vibrio TaxID=662 RepID=UPI0018685249|nr:MULTISPECIES: hypothetical protein [Vibrio]
MSQASNSTKRKTKFAPNFENFKTCLSYEGLSFKEKSKTPSIAELKQKYAR